MQIKFVVILKMIEFKIFQNNKQKLLTTLSMIAQ